MTQYVPTEKWKDASIEVPEYGVIKKSHILNLGGAVESYLLTQDYVRRFNSATDATVVEDANSSSTPSNKSSHKKTNTLASSNNQETPAE